jgi:phosphoribosylformylglycinamidine synthase
VHILPVSRTAPLTAELDPEQPLCIPIAHGEGNYTVDADGLKALEDGDQVLFRYCDEAGEIQPWTNPNGSMAHIAGVSNASHTVFGMMPHPERAASADLANTDGLGILKGLLSWVTA